jgi:hypothetical protein
MPVLAGPLIIPRRNFLISAIGFTAAGATLPIPIIVAETLDARIEHHLAELCRAFAGLNPGRRFVSDYRRPTGVAYALKRGEIVATIRAADTREIVATVSVADTGAIVATTINQHAAAEGTAKALARVEHERIAMHGAP